MSMDNIRVGIRVRPLDREKEVEDPSATLRYDENTITFYRDAQPTNSFTFDNVFGDEAQTIDVYNALAKSIIESTLQGVNGTIFAYGQTSSGKTHTMKGDADSPGIIPLAISEIFSFIQQAPEREFLLRVSYLEIYNEEIRDLLNPAGPKLEIREDFEKGVIVKDAKEEIVVLPQQALQLMAYGEEHRHVGATNANSASSRSHTIFKMVIESRERSDKENGSKKSIEGAVKVSILNLVDLAGSERLAHTLATGVRMLEGCKINQSLSTLGTVISKLAEGERGHIPYRNSKLTRMLEPALGGNSRTAIICTITPAPAFREESISTLKFANRAKQIKNKPKVNEVMDQASMLKRYKQQISKLQKKLKKIESKDKNWEELAIQKQKAEEDKEIMMQLLRDAEIERRQSKEKLARMMNYIITASPEHAESTVKAKAKWNRRETWAPNRGSNVAASSGPTPIPRNAGVEFMAAPLPPPRPCSARPAPDPIETEKIKEELQIANQRLQQLQEINAKLEHELEEEKNRGKQLSQAVASQLESSGPNTDALAQASAFILQLQQELESTRRKLDDQEEMHEILTEEAVTMERQLAEVNSQYEISESASRQFQEQVLQLQKSLSEESAEAQRRAQEQAQTIAQMKTQLDESQKEAQEYRNQATSHQLEVQQLQQQLSTVEAALNVMKEQRDASQARLTDLEVEVARLQQEKQKQQETLTLLREEHAMTQTKLHTSYNKRIDNLETKVTKLEKEKEDTEEDHRQEIAQLLAQQSSALACQQDVERLQSELLRAQEENLNLTAAVREAVDEAEALRKNLQIARTESDILRQKSSFNEGSSFCGSLPSNRRISMAPVAFQEARMKEDLKSTTVKRNQLQLENDSLKKEKEKVLKDLANLDGKYKQVVKDKSQLQIEKVSLEKEVKRLTTQNTSLEKQMDKTKSKENKIKEERDQRIAVEKQLATLTKTHEKLQAQVIELQEQLKQKEEALNQLRTEFLMLNQLNGEMESKKSDLEEEVARLNASSKQLSDLITEQSATIEKLKTTVQAQSATLQTKETHLADIQKEKEQLHAQLIAMREKITVQATDLLQYDKKVQAMTVDLNGLQSQLQANDKQRSTLQQQLVGLNHRLSLTEQQLEGVRREKAVLDERFDVLKQENKLVETQLANEQKERMMLEEKWNILQKDKAAVDEQLTDAFFSMEQLKAEWNSKERELNQQLQSLATEFKARVELIEQIEKEKAHLGSELDDMTQIRNKLLQDFQELTAKYEDAVLTASKLEENNQNLIKTLEDTHVVLDQLEKDKNSDLERFQQEKIILEEKNFQLEGDMDIVREELQASKEKMALLEHDSQLVQHQADSLQQELDMLQQTYNALQETHQQTQERIVALEKEVTELSQVKAKAIEDREQFEHQKAVLSDRFESQLSEANKHHEALTYEKANLSAELEKIKRTLQDATEFRDQEIKHLNREIRKKTKEIQKCELVIESNKSAIESLFRDQQELSVMKQRGCTACGASYSSPDPSLLRPLGDATQTMHFSLPPAQALPSPSPPSSPVASPEHQHRPSQPIQQLSIYEESIKQPSVTNELSTGAPCTKSVVPDSGGQKGQGQAKRMSTHERMAALKERAIKMKEAASTTAPSAISAKILGPTVHQFQPPLPKGILKRQTVSIDDKENMPSTYNS